MKGGKLYFTPLKEQISAFDSSLLLEKKIVYQEQTEEEQDPEDILFEFDPEFLNSKQFTNLINSYVSDNFINSEIYVNDLISFIKDNYAESRIEKNAKLLKVSEGLINFFKKKDTNKKIFELDKYNQKEFIQIYKIFSLF